MANKSWVVVVDCVVEGNFVVGPFESSEAAEEWGNNRYGEDSDIWYVTDFKESKEI